MFNRGDRVLCIRESTTGHFGVLGGVYTVSNYIQGNDILELEESGQYLMGSRFTLLDYFSGGINSGTLYYDFSNATVSNTVVQQGNSQELRITDEMSDKKKEVIKKIREFQESIDKLKKSLQNMS